MQDQDDIIVRLQNVDFRFKKIKILDNINLEIRKGDFVGIIGPNGSGKTTLLKIILGILKPQEGQVFLKNPKKVGYIPQKVTQFDSRFPITVEEVVSLGNSQKEVIQASLETVSMAKYSKRLLSQLSGGQQQRVFIAKALASEPQFLILDEPTVGIDTKTQEEFYEILAHLNKKKGLTIVLVSHDIDVVVNEVNSLICINKKLVYHGTPKEFIKEDYLEKLYGKNRKFIIHGH
jgi:zinc transport system ATP-binding protein